MLKKYRRFTGVAIISLSLLLNVNAQKGTPSFQIQTGLIDGEDFVSKTIIFKVKPEYRSLCSENNINYPALKTFFQQMGVQKLEKIYPHEPIPERMYNIYGQKMVDLTLLYEYTYTANIPLQQALNNIAKLGLFEYAEYHVIAKPIYAVNDPAVVNATTTTLQYHIGLIKAPQAWDISKGDTNVVIGIVDTGTEPTHPDLKNSIKHNYKDPINGVDDDGDGYVDNFTGWDTGMNDNDPTWPSAAPASASPQHGIHCSGIAAASTDNSTGGAGVGFKCKFLPVKISDDVTGKLTNGYIGIQYAADHGCKVISCSWGGGSSGQYGQDIIDYATFNKDALVVGGAGNDGKEALFYPACYNNVICVAATGTADKLSTYSNFGHQISICAPGDNIYSTWSGTGYNSISGTSMATPCIAGAIAIVRSFYPGYSALQAGERLCMTADNIDSKNSIYKTKLGTGRVNLYRALSDPASPAISMTSRTISTFKNKAITAGDTINITGIYTNYLAPTTNLTATLLTTSTYVTIIASTATATLGVIPTMGTGNNTSKPFKVLIKNGTPLNTDVIFQIKFTDGTYTYSQYFDVVVNVDYLNVAVNDISTSVTSRGGIGWNNDPPTQGLGFQYKGTQMTYETGLMVGIPDSAVSNCVRGTPTKDLDFTASVNVRRVGTGAISDFDTEGYFSDDVTTTPANPQPLPTLIHQKSYSFSTPGDTKYILLRYIIHNKGTSTLSNLYAGIFADFDIQGKNGDSNRVGYDATNKLLYTFYTKTNGLYGGIKLLSHTAAPNAYAIDNDTTGMGGVNMVDHGGFERHEKYITLSTMRTAAGMKGMGNDVCEVMGSGPFTLNAGDSVEVAFAILGGDNLGDIQTSSVNAQTKYDGVVLGTPVITARQNSYTLQSYPNPASGNSIIEVNIPQTGRMELKLYDVIGKEVATIASGDYSTGKYQFTFDASKLNNGVYYYQLVSGDNKLVRKMVVSK